MKTTLHTQAVKVAKATGVVLRAFLVKSNTLMLGNTEIKTVITKTKIAKVLKAVGSMSSMLSYDNERENRGWRVGSTRAISHYRAV